MGASPFSSPWQGIGITRQKYLVRSSLRQAIRPVPSAVGGLAPVGFFAGHFRELLPDVPVSLCRPGFHLPSYAAAQDRGHRGRRAGGPLTLAEILANSGRRSRL